MKTIACAFAVAVLAALVLAPTAAEACSCFPRPIPVCEEISRSSVIFVGKVLSVTTPTPRPTPSAQYNTVRFAVEEAFKGVTTSETTVETASSTAMCGYAFQVGTTYLVYGSGT